MMRGQKIIKHLKVSVMIRILRNAQLYYVRKARGF